MKKPPHVIEIFLQPGEHYFGGRDTRIRTLLGSCVAITLWHPRLLVGGMCHYMLPSRLSPAQPDGRYADEAVELLLGEIRQVGAPQREYQAKLFGGGNMFPQLGQQRAEHVGLKNVETGRSLLKRHGLTMHSEHAGGCGHRNLLFDIWSGHVWMKHLPPVQPVCRDCRAMDCEARKLCEAA